MTMDHKKTQNNSRRINHLSPEQSPLLPNEVDDEGFHGASFSGSVFNLSTTIIGAGIMALPAAMKVLGLGLGIAAIVFLVLLTETSLEILIRFSRVGKADTYGEVMRYAFGSVGRGLFQICVLLNNFGILVVYVIIIGSAFICFIDELHSYILQSIE